MSKKEVKPCPFCGSNKSKIEFKRVLDGYLLDAYRVMRKTFSVRCNSCFARGGAVGGKVIESYEHFISEHELPEWCEVIGNKFDNPELIKGGEKNGKNDVKGRTRR